MKGHPLAAAIRVALVRVLLGREDEFLARLEANPQVELRQSSHSP
jgi:hypothetical protein